MKKLCLGLVLLGTLAAPAQAASNTTVGVGAGAVTGALVAGPVGAVVGAVVGGVMGANSGAVRSRRVRRVRAVRSRRQAAIVRPASEARPAGLSRLVAEPVATATIPRPAASGGRAWQDPR
ncbi:hypothetical protein [Methylobacterium iners]|uniref:Glycine zipper domain-containing protein n=1 Tax=Methylobacterium iners TaxID=418707 RepID=A0ABQ4RTD7_9HYPH|nr:hypothetical protein [Methylobacterium iners]GJD93457.1 hypothetical protein OCOJLMKI_0652 [Methylobacterium iners]